MILALKYSRRRMACRNITKSSLSNSGYMLSNSVGLIDSSYRGTLKVTLTKIANDAEDIKIAL